MKWYVEFLDKYGVKFLNVNEFEFSEMMFKMFFDMGF